MQTSVLGQSATQNYQEVKDSESRINVNGDNTGTTYCGPRLYSIDNPPSYVSIDPDTRSITVTTENEADIGKHILDFRVTL